MLHSHRFFSHSDGVFASLSSEAASRIASLGSDITLLLTDEGVIQDVAYREADLEAYGLDTWVGQPWEDTVTVESTEKIRALLEDSSDKSTTRRRQVNHPMKGQADLPVDYMVLSVEGFPYRLAIGEDFRKLAKVQQQLIQTQLELEKEYRKIREAETRYRTVFQKLDRATLVVDGSDRRIMDANAAAAGLLQQRQRKLIGANLTTLVARAERDTFSEAVNEALHGGLVQRVTTKLNAPDIEITASMEPFRENGRTNILVHIDGSGGAIPDHDTGSASHRALFDSLPEALATIDAKGLVTDVNEQFLDIVQVMNRNQVIGRSLNNWLGTSSVDMQVLVSRLRDEGQVRQFSTVVRDELGTQKQVTVSASNYGHGDDERIGVLIAEQRRGETRPTLGSADTNAGTSDFSELVGRVPLKELIRESVDVIEKMCIEAALRQTGNNRASAADMLGLSRQSLYIKLKRYNLENFRPTSSMN